MPKKPKILFIVSGLGIGGVQKQTVDIANAMVKRNFEAVFLNLAIRNDKNLLKDISPEIPVVTSRYFSKLSKSRIFSSFISSMYAIYETARTVRNENVDIIYSGHWLGKIPATIVGILFGMRNRVVLIESSNSEYEIRRKNISAMSKTLVFLVRKTTYKMARSIISVSSGLAEQIGKYFGVKDKVRVIRNGVNLKLIETKAKAKVEHPYFNDDTPTIVSVGRLDSQKGFSFLIDALALLNKKMRVRLIIVGDGQLKDVLMNKINNMHLEEYISLTGQKENPYPFIAAADLYVQSSIYEGFGNTMIEAATLGKPIVSTNYPFGANEIVNHGETGLLVPVGDEKAMASAIEQVLKNDEMRNKMGKNAEKKAQNFTLEIMVSKYEKLFREVIDDFYQVESRNP